MRARIAIALTAAALTLTACTADESGNSADGEEISLVATTTPLGSVTSQIATCAGGTSTTLMPAGADPHDFSASSAQVADLVKADLVIANGLGLEGGLDTSLDQVEADGTGILRVAEHVDPLPFGEHGHAHGDLDPHFSFDAARMATAAQLIGDEVAQRSGDIRWAECGTQVAQELSGLDEELRETLSAVPGGSTEAQPSSQDLARLAGVIKEEGIPVIFSNVAVNPALVEALAAEVGEEVSVVPLYVESVGPEESAAADYQGMMRENARVIVETLA